MVAITAFNDPLRKYDQLSKAVGWANPSYGIDCDGRVEPVREQSGN
jgi:hypothetical protein